MSDIYQTYSHTHRTFDFAEQAPTDFVQGLRARTAYLDQDYAVLILQDKEIIEYIYDQSQIPVLDSLKYTDYLARKNSQLLAPVLIGIVPRTHEHTGQHVYTIGEAYSALALWALEQGWQTGFCICFERQPVEIRLRGEGLLPQEANFGSIPFLCIGHHDSTVPWNFQRRDVNQIVPSPEKLPRDQYIRIL